MGVFFPRFIFIFHFSPPWFSGLACALLHPPIHLLMRLGDYRIGMADEKLFGTLGACGNCNRVASFSLLFYILSHVYCLMGVFIFQGKEIFIFIFSNGSALLCSVRVCWGLLD